jgi:hypothetical protein
MICVGTVGIGLLATRVLGFTAVALATRARWAALARRAAAMVRGARRCRGVPQYS